MAWVKWNWGRGWNEAREWVGVRGMNKARGWNEVRGWNQVRGWNEVRGWSGVKVSIGLSSEEEGEGTAQISGRVMESVDYHYLCQEGMFLAGFVFLWVSLFVST